MRRDRGYEADYPSVQRNPDVTTIWALSALLDPEGEDTQPDHTLALPLSNTIHYLQADPTLEEPEHPFIVLPKLFQTLHPAAGYSFLTTLTLDGMDNAVTDMNVLNLRYCTHLTVLHTRGCKIGDTPIRLLASALDLERKMGMCRLRAWFMPGCRGIGDRSMRSLSRWPGLCVLDVRGTSVTVAGMGILNRFQRTHFAGEIADYQTCTPGLRPIFSRSASAAETLESLCSSLLSGEAPAPGRGIRPKWTRQKNEGDETVDRWWLALHLIPATQPLEPAWLPYKRSDPVKSGAVEDTGAYFPGLGKIYTNDVQGINMRITKYGPDLER